ncbi:MAG: translocation/assembly module TamB domain-containing protein [Deltaproteobacteria bacterium]|nr:translocation/assembly module TamB domain-containing protein [Deltaproteobacteria bacterium]
MVTPVRPGSTSDDHHDERHDARPGWLRWTKRIVLGLAALTIVLVVLAIGFIHTDYGRETVRQQVEKQLQTTFAGGATVGKLEGSPFGDLVLRDFVINGPDGKPAIKIGTLRTHIRILDLIKKDIRLDHLIVEQVDVALKRDADGSYQIARLLKPSDPTTEPTKSTWTIVLPKVSVRDAHVMLETGDPELGTVNLDGVAIDASALLPPQGDTKSASLALTGTWRERKAAFEVSSSIADDGSRAFAQSLKVLVGGVSVTGANLAITRRPERAPLIEGLVHVLARRADVAALDPRIELPDDVEVSLNAAIDNGQKVTLSGSLGPTPITGVVNADLDARHVFGQLTSGDLDLARLTAGRIVAVVGAKADFDVVPGAPGELPTAKVDMVGHGTYQGLPRSDFTLHAATAGHHISTAVDVTGATTAKIRAELDRVADALTLTSGTIVASTASPARATGGKAPVHGSLAIDLAANGRIAPEPMLAVSGTVKGKRLRMQDLSVASLDLAIDATQLPKSPNGRVSVRMQNVVRGDMRLGVLNADAATRPDGKIQATVTSRPAQDPWLVELAALITPPGKAKALVVDLQRHHVRVGNGEDWRGTSGQIVVGPEVVQVRDLRSKGDAGGTLVVDGSFVRDGRRKGDLMAKVDLDKFALATLKSNVSGHLDAHVDLARRSGGWNGTIDIAARKMAAGIGLPGGDAEAKIKVSPSQLVVTAGFTTLKRSGAKLFLDLSPPARFEDAAAWKRRGRDAINKARIELTRIDLAKLAEMLPTDDVSITHGPNISYIKLHGTQFDLSGRVNGTIELDRTTANGKIEVRELHTSALRGVKTIDADLDLQQTQLDELVPTLRVRIAEVGNAVASARLALPTPLFDPQAWQRLGTGVIRQATINTDLIAIDPAMLARLGIHSTMRGKAKLDVFVGNRLDTIKVTALADEVRGTPIATPVSIRAAATIDDKQAKASIAMTSQGKPLTLLKFDGTVPITVARLRSEKPDLATLPLKGKLTIPSTSAPQLLNVVGRSEIASGTIDGTVDITGTIGQPEIVARLAGHDLAARPIRQRRIQTIKVITLAATWNKAGGTLKIDGTEDRGGLLSVLAKANPGALGDATATIKAKNFDTGPLLAFAPGPAGGAEGTLDANLSVKGFDPKTSKILGELHVKHARIPLAPSIGTLRKANIDIQIRDHDIVLGATGKLGAGDLKASGTIALDGVSLTGGHAKITLRKVSPIGSVEPQIDADIDAKIARTNQVWTADVVIDRGFVKVAKRDGQRLKEIGLPADLTIGPQKPKRAGKGPTAPPKRASLIANITLKPMRVESKEARTVVKGKIRLTADGEGVGAVGTIAANSGDVDLFDRRYRLERAAVTFDGTIDPRLDVRFSYDFPDVQTVTVVRGRLSKPELVLSSNPGQYTQAQLLGFLLGGEPNGDPSSGSARDKATSAGMSLVANQLAGYVRKALPFDVDVLRYEAAGVGSSASITVGTWLTRSVFFAFRQHLDAQADENSSEGTVEYWLNRQLEIQGMAGDRGITGVDILWRKRF